MSPWLRTREKESGSQTDDGAAASSSFSSDAQAAANAGAYKLSAVVMHVGGPAAGHYYAYVRYTNPASVPPAPGSPDALKAKAGRVSAGKGVCNKQQPTTPSTTASASAPTWVTLDDHRVTKVSEAEVLRDAFGGGGGVYTGPGAELQGFFGQVMFCFDSSPAEGGYITDLFAFVLIDRTDPSLTLCISSL